MMKLNHYTILSFIATVLFFQATQLAAQTVSSTQLETEEQFNQLFPKKVEQVQSDAEESMPLVTSADDQFYFIRTQVSGRKKLNKYGQEIWVAEREGDSWGSPKKENLKINDLSNNAVIGTSADGSTIYVFNSLQTRHKLARGLGYMTKDSLGNWGEIQKITIPGFEIGDGYYAFYVTPDERTLLVSAALDTMAYEDIYVSEKIDGKWSALKSLGTTVNTSEIETSPFITADKNTLYFSSAGHGGYGETDLFKSTRMGEGWDQWSTPVNLGDKINSSAFDAYLVVSSDERTAYFSSNRDGNYSDIYEVSLVNEEGSQEINDTEFTIVKLSLEGTVLSNQEIQVYDANGELIETVLTGQNGEFSYKPLAASYYVIDGMKVPSDDMVAFIASGDKREISNDNLEVLVDLNTYRAADTEFTIVKLSLEGTVLSNQEIQVYDANGELIETVLTGKSGEFSYKPTAGAYYVIDEMKVVSEDMAEFIKNANNDIANILGTKKREEESMSDNEQEFIIYFDFDKSIIKPEEKIKLDELIALSKNRGQLQVKLIGHTDYKGPQTYNLTLSNKRVKAVNDYLIDKGLDKSRIISKEAKGELIPIAENSTIIGRAMNRRVEIKIKI
ncbi:OmpA family protein [Vicingaceae bacterium]|nr:OmpA family protein [Vicingaceae bacterium]